MNKLGANIDLFDTPIRHGKVRNGIYYNQYRTGVININGQKYLGYSIKDAITLWRKNNKIAALKK